MSIHLLAGFPYAFWLDFLIAFDAELFDDCCINDGNLCYSGLKTAEIESCWCSLCGVG